MAHGEMIMSRLEHKVPAFVPGPLKKEMMVCLRDIALDEQDIRYYQYTDGIVMGCDLAEESMKIGLINGIVKFGGRLYKLKEKTLVPYKPTDEWTVLKLRFGTKLPDKEYIHYAAELVLDANMEIKPNELEMGRFKLKKGSRLRTVYKDFWDMVTEYDTVNLVHVRQSAPHFSTLSPAITINFAREAFRYAGTNPLDAAFCTACLASEATIGRELITRYICTRLDRKYGEMSNVELYEGLADILALISGRARKDLGKNQMGGVLLIN